MTVLSSDRPCIDPNDDLFGHSPFAKSLADSICCFPGSDGLVLALYGPWGSGKSTVLNYVQYHIEQHLESEQPVIVSFNPWWFTGQENLAHSFLGQLQAVLPEKFSGFKRLGEKIAEFSDGIGGLAELVGDFAGVGGVVKTGMKLLAGKPKDIPALKTEISNILLVENKRVLVIIDDIDRLTPEETRQLFTVIKALADFPNVIYLLAFDREVAAQAIELHSKMPGDRYLEKIIQVPFEIPPVDRVALINALCKRLDAIMSSTPEGLFDQTYWTNVFLDGIDTLFQVPRDIVRFTNTLTVTYPSVVGNVNPVDFIAIEALRVFMPKVYDVIRSNPEKFTGCSDDRSKDKKSFHENWLKDFSEEIRSQLWPFLTRIIPKLQDCTHDSSWTSSWRRELRICHPEIFPTFFRLAIPIGSISRNEIISLLALAGDPAALGGALIQATHVIRPDGLSKARALLERLMDHAKDDLQEAHVPSFINVLLGIGDELILAGDAQGMFDFGNESRVSHLVYQLLKRLEPSQRNSCIKEAFTAGCGIQVQRYLLKKITDQVQKESTAGNETFVSSSAIDDLKMIWVENVKKQLDLLLLKPQLLHLLIAWKDWGDNDDVRNWVDAITMSDDGLIAYITQCCLFSSSQTVGDSAIRVKPSLNPNWIAPFTNILSCSQRLFTMLQDEKIPDRSIQAVSQYLKEYEMIQNGKNPDGWDS